MMRAHLADVLARIPGAPSVQWPKGDRYALAFSHGSMSVGYYAPIGSDPQQLHKRDEIYIIHSGNGDLLIDGERTAFVAGDVLFVAAGVEHRFENFSADFASWVVFWGPTGGELEPA